MTKRYTLFLDINGVLNDRNTTQRDGQYIGIDPAMVANLNTLIERLGGPESVRVVLTSTRRYAVGVSGTLESMRQAGYRYGIDGATPRIEVATRGGEIASYMVDHDVERGRSVILDDKRMDWLDDRAVRTSWGSRSKRKRGGLQPWTIDEVLGLLGVS